MNPYEELGVAPDATPDEIKAAARRRSKDTHPDRGGDAEAFQRVRQAVMVLSDPARREKYDRTGSTEPESENAFESEAMGLVGGLLQNAVMPPPNAPALDLDRYDIAAVMRQSLRDLIAQADRDIATVKKQIERAGKARARWVKKNKAKNAAPGDPILDMLGQMERERREVLEKAEYQRRVLLRAQEILADYSYRTDAPNPASGWATSGRGGGWGLLNDVF